jgi:hypothetical protein
MTLNEIPRINTERFGPIRYRAERLVLLIALSMVCISIFKQWKKVPCMLLFWLLGMDDTRFHIPAPISEPHVEVFHLFLSDWILQRTDSSHPSSVFTTTVELLGPWLWQEPSPYFVTNAETHSSSLKNWVYSPIWPSFKQDHRPLNCVTRIFLGVFLNCFFYSNTFISNQNLNC